MMAKDNDSFMLSNGAFNNEGSTNFTTMGGLRAQLKQEVKIENQ